MELVEVISKSIECIDKIILLLHKLQEKSISVYVDRTLTLLSSLKSKLEALKNSEDFESLNPVSLQSLIDRLFSYLSRFDKDSQEWIHNFTEEEDDDLLIFTSKLESFDILIDVAASVPKDDLLCLEKSHPRWLKLATVSSIHTYPDSKQVMKHYKDFMVQVAVANAFMAVGLEESSLFEKKVMVGIGAMYYSVFRCYAVRRTRIFIAKPNIEVAQNM